jgi:hypothetical protein
MVSRLQNSSTGENTFGGNLACAAKKSVGHRQGGGIFVVISGLGSWN